MKTMMKLIGAGAVVAGSVAIVRAMRRRKEDAQVMTEDDLFVDPVVITTEEVFVITEEDPSEPSTFTT